MDLGLNGRVALVTGSSRGIGRAVAEAFAREGARVAVTYCHHRAEAEAVATNIRAFGGDALVTFFDLASYESIVSAANCVLGRWGRIDVLVNNAVQWADHLFVEAPPFEQLSPERWQFVVRANLEGAYTAIQTVLPSMRSGQWGRVVNISAVVAADGVAGSAWYAAAKSALHGLTRSLSKEVGTDGILVNAVMPGLTMSDRTLAMVPEALRQTYALATPIGRLLDATEVAATVVFLASTANTAITGEIIRASGGFITPHRPHPNLRQRTDAISSSADARSSMLVGVKA